MAKKSNFPRIIVLLLVVVAGAFVAYAWLHKHHPPGPTSVPEANTPEAQNVPLAVAVDKIDPANEDRFIVLTGDLKVVTPTHDTQLGIDADAVMLLRYADMLQWEEKCNGTTCTYQQVWTPQLVSSKKFRVPEGHQNPTRMPVTTARYSASEVRLGAFRINAAALGNSRVGTASPIQPVPYPVTDAKLPSNLAISFRDRKGILYAGDPDHPAVGDVRVIYRIIPAEKVEVTGIQHGDGIIVKTAKSTQPSS